MKSNLLISTWQKNSVYVSFPRVPAIRVVKRLEGHNVSTKRESGVERSLQDDRPIVERLFLSVNNQNEVTVIILQQPILRTPKQEEECVHCGNKCTCTFLHHRLFVCTSAA
uniref:Uncharacterized protein n=1 Tax=Steinernema glaseri TaxID=37863 RepID=A0A1I8ASH0_9BILA